MYDRCGVGPCEIILFNGLGCYLNDSLRKDRSTGLRAQAEEEAAQLRVLGSFRRVYTCLDGHRGKSLSVR